MERWIVRTDLGRIAVDTEVEADAREVHADLPGSTLHRLVEAREKVWVVRDRHKTIVEVLTSPPSDLELRFFAREDLTCREEWLGGGE